MSPARAPSPTLLASTPVDGRIAWMFFGGGALLAALFALSALLLPGSLPPARRVVIALSCLALGGLFLLGRWLVARRPIGGVALGISYGGVAVATLTAVMMETPAGALPLALLGYFVLMAAVFCGTRAAVVLSGVCALAVLGRHALVPEPGWVGTVLDLLLVASGLLVGVATSRALAHTVRLLGEREQRFSRLLGIAVDWYWEQDADLRFTLISDSVVDDTGVPAHEHLGRTRWEIPELELTPEQWAAHRAELDARRPFRDLVMRRPDVGGQPRYISVSGEPVFDAAGTFCGYWGVGRTITADVLAQRALRASEERYRELFARSPTPMLIHRGGGVLDANEAAAQLFGYADAAAMRGIDIVWHYGDDGEQLARVRARIAECEALPIGRRLPLAEFSLRRLDGRRAHAQVTGLRIHLDDGPATVSIYVDLTARKAAEQALGHSQTLLARLFDTTPDTVTLTELGTGRYLMINEHFTQVLGWTAEDAIGRTATDLGIWRDVADRERMVNLIAEHGTARDLTVVFTHKSGAPVPLRVSAASFSADGVDYLVVVGRDVAAAEQARMEREAILQHASVGIAFTRDRRFVHANPRFEQMFGWPPGGLAGQQGIVVWPGERDYHEVSATAGPLLAAGKRFEVERVMKRLDGSLFWARLQAQVVDPGDPSRGGTIWIADDVTERRQVDQALSAARDAAEAASRAKSAFLANTSHEIRTPLNGLLGLARLLQKPDLAPARREQYLAQILDSAQNLSNIISDILDLSKIEAGKLSLESLPFAVRELLNATARGYEALAEERGLTLSWLIAPDVPTTVSGDPVRVRQILGNFLSNAIKFTDRGGVRVELACVRGDRLRFTVADTGPGIDAETRARLFRPFTQADQSITRRYGGTGLGLSICRELATLMGGKVGVDSDPGQGSRFWAELPLPPAEAIAVTTGDTRSPAERLAGARVLVVEDNAVNMLIVRAMLEGWSVQVTEAGDGQQALDAVAAAEQAGTRFDAVLMDVQMPVMSGHEAARRLRERHDPRALPIIALTAAALVSERDQALAAGMDAFLTKPIDAEQLLRALARAIDARETA